MDDIPQQIDDWAAAVVVATDVTQVSQIWQRVPLAQEDAVLDAVAQRAAVLAQAGDERGAARAQIWLAELRRSQRARDEQPPYVAAIEAFLQAADEAARQVFAARQVVLQPYEAQAQLDRLVADAPEEKLAHLTARAVLLRTLRGVAPIAPPASALPPTTVPAQPATIIQAGQDIYLYSAHAEGAGSAVVINSIGVERRWQRPTPPALLRRPIQRTHDLQQVAQLLAACEQVAISGPTAAAVQGMPGIGKTTLARQLAHELDAQYPDGVIWQEIGPQISVDQVQRILNQWAQVALLLPPSLDNNVQFDPGAVRTLFRDRRLLVILDDVWSLDVIRPLREALPDGTHLILTTRLETVTVGLGGGEHVLGILTPEEAQALIALRLFGHVIPADHQGWCDSLAQGVGYHPLALDVALGVLRLDGDRPQDWQQTAAQVVAALRTGQGFDDLQIPNGDREQHVERVLAYSYERMDAIAQERFRLLGTMAEDASWATAHIAQLWQCDERTARRQMNTLVNAALLSRTEQRDRWQQHSLLRGYALALLRRAGAAEAANAQHAAIYDAAMQQADVAQHYHTMLPDYPQVRHAVAWAIENDLVRAQRLINNVATLQAAFGFAREGLTWSLQAREAVQQRGTAADAVWALGIWGNALCQSAKSFDDDRAGFLYRALAAYDETLLFFSPDTNPLDFATTQNNRAVVLSMIANLPGEDCAARLYEALASYEEALHFRRSDTTPLDFAMTQSNRASLFRKLANLPEEDPSTRLHEALKAYDQALHFFHADTTPLAFAMVQNNRGTVFCDLAGRVGENRSTCLHEALTAFDDALHFRRPDTDPYTYATTQNNRGIVLRHLASLPGENRAVRLLEALSAYDGTLYFFRPDITPLDFAITQDNRGAVLRDLASQDGEDRSTRLREALTAYEEALRFRRSDTDPHAYAATQNNRGTVLRDLATQDGEDQSTRLCEALAAYEEALRFFHPDTDPLAFARAQTNRGTTLCDLASHPGEDQSTRLREALAAYEEALRFLRPDTAPLDFATTQNNRGTVLRDLATQDGEDQSTRLREALAAYEEALRFFRPDTAPLDFAMVQGNLAGLLDQIADLPNEDQQYCRQASLAAAWAAFTTFTALQHTPFQQQAADQVRELFYKYGSDFLLYWGKFHLGPFPDWLEPYTNPPYR
ncbi:hypothetical protein F8S13_22090 [Chloroflexia bacterium SDU3-3]|nr:hypothetical protein F8S13_22090 [Chloroflexia bacterium SDU3-3]